MNLRQRADFFHQLSELLRAGIPWRPAVDRMASHPLRSSRRERLLVALGSIAETTAADHLQACPVALATWEWGLLVSGCRTGKLPQATERIAQELEITLDAQRQMRKHCAYPLWLAHLAVILLSIPAAILHGGSHYFFLTVCGLLALLWAVLLGAIVFARGCERLGRQVVWMENILRSLPAWGIFWSRSAAARWAVVLGWVFRSGGGLLGALPWAAEAAGTAGARRVSRRIEEDVRAGRSLAEAAVDENWLPEEVRQGLWAGEQTGRLADEMDRAAQELREQSMDAIKTWSRWVPRILYALVVLLAAWRIIDWAQGYYRTVGELLLL